MTTKEQQIEMINIKEEARILGLAIGLIWPLAALGQYGFELEHLEDIEFECRTDVDHFEFILTKPR